MYQTLKHSREVEVLFVLFERQRGDPFLVDISWPHHIDAFPLDSSCLSALEELV